MQSGPDAFKRVKGEDASPDKVGPSDILPRRLTDLLSLQYDSGPESGFSDFNPFQSGGEDSPEPKAARRKVRLTSFEASRLR